jgi:hypothetical protein
MMRRLLPALGIAALAIAAVVPAHAQGAPPRALPPGEGRDLLVTACSQCHVLNVIMSMREGPAGWRRHVHNMVTRGAQLTAPEAETVIAYLAANFGPGSAAAGAAVVALPARARRQHGRPRRGGESRRGTGDRVLSGGALRWRVTATGKFGCLRHKQHRLVGIGARHCPCHRGRD